MDLNNGNDVGPPPPLVVSQYVIDMVNFWRADRNFWRDDRRQCITDAGKLWGETDEDRIQQRMLHFGRALTPLNRLESIFIVGNLMRELLLEGIGNNTRTTVLVIFRDVFSDEALGVFCGFLSRTPHHLVSLSLYSLPNQQFRRLLEALHTNTSVKELTIGRHHDCALIEALLRYKTDFTKLKFHECHFRISDNLRGLFGGLTHLKRLAFIACRINDDDVHVFLRGNYPSLAKLCLTDNQITSTGFGFMARQIREALPNLEILVIQSQRGLLNNPENVRLFTQNVMPVLKGLDISFSDEDSGYAQIIKACEADTLGKLKFLNIYTNIPNQATTSNQLAESLPKMKVKRFNCARVLITSSDPALMSALYKNTTIVEVSREIDGRHIIKPILQRNKLMANIKKYLLGGGTRTIVPTAVVAANDENIITPLGRWSRVLAEIGHERVRHGATPVYMILQAVLAQWVEVSWDVWEHRNGILHDKEKGQAALEREERIKDEFEEGWEELDRDARLLFRPGVARVLQYQAAQQKWWIARIETARLRAAVQRRCCCCFLLLIDKFL